MLTCMRLRLLVPLVTGGLALIIALFTGAGLVAAALLTAKPGVGASSPVAAVPSAPGQ